MRLSYLFAVVAFAGTLSAAPKINEIMFHPAGTLEDPSKEWIELYNPDASATNMSGWSFTKGISYTIPPGTSIPAGGYVVVAANPAVFVAANPGFAGTVIGGWTGRLSNSGEQIQLDDETGSKVVDVTYADEGDWGLRARGPLSFSHRGWIWESQADGTGRTLEVRNPTLSIESGQNWGASQAIGGTPGAVNSLHATNRAPLIRDAKHRPEIPKTTDPIVISCDVEDEAAGATATLHWRLDGGSWQTAPMTDTDADGDVEATILPQGNLMVIEWYISATDGVNSRTWPAPARTSDIGVVPETFAQVTNTLLQVDNSYDPAATFMTPADQPIYRMILTAAERNELLQIQTTAGQEDSEATFNATFISHDGTGLKTRYGCGVRNRGQASALGPPNNYHVSFPSSDRWNGRAAFGINCQYGYSQALGQALFDRAGIATQESAIIRVRLNGANLAESGNRMYGRYVRIEGRGGDWAENHYPDDSDGNFYRLDDHAYPQGDARSGEFRWEGPLVASYSDTFLKETNKDANDFSDLMNLCRIVSAPITGGTGEQPAISNGAYPAAVEAVLDLDNFYRFIATDALVGNQEGGLQSGRADDVSIYAGVSDPRFRFVPHDLDDIFDIGSGVGDPNTRSIFAYDTTNGGVAGLTRLFNHPQLIPRYYAALIDATNTWFNRATIDPIVDQIMAGWVPATDGSPAAPNRGIAEIKNYVDVRRANVLSQIQQNYSLVITGNAADSPEGYKVTTTGAATFSGTFNVARTYSVTVNGQLAQWFYRTVGADAAGTWKMVVPAGGGTVLRPGLNYVTINFWDQPNGTGTILQSYTAQVLNQPAAPTYTTVSGSLTPPGALTMTVPSNYIPGIPVLVRVDLKDPNGNLDRTAWNRTATLTASNGVTFSPNTVTVTNGMGSALITIGGGGGGGSQTIFSYGTGGTGTTATTSGTPGSTWKGLIDLTNATIGAVPATWKDEGFDDSTWISLQSQTGYGDNDENRAFARVDFDPGATGTQGGPSYLFRNTFTIADLSQFSSVTGQIKYDDAYAIYVNGTPVQNSGNLPTGTALTAYSNGDGPSDNATADFTIPLNLLKNGVNTIAVEIHQGDSTSTDVTFDLRLQANLPASDPGNFTLTAAVGALNASKAIASLGSAPTMTNVSGALPAGTTNWSGVMNVTGDVTVPAGGTLNIAAGTLVLVNGTLSGSGGADLIVAGTLNALGTQASPISITCSNAANRWGEINFPAGASASTLQYCLVSRACHSPGGGHTGTGPMVRLNGTTITIDDSVLSDSPGKTMTNSGNCNITIRRTHFARCVMGPELDGSGLTLEDSNLTEMLPIYRETGAADDEDCIYIHDSGGRPVNIRRTVLSNCGDDALDCLAGTLTVEDSIIRNAFDKGASLLNNNVTMRRVQIIDNDIGVSTKCQVGGPETTPFLNVFENCTIVSENHPTNTSDGDFHSVGIHTRNKYGTTTMNITVQVKNCIISAEEPVANDYGVAGNLFPLMNFTYSDLQDLGGVIPNNPVPTGTGVINANPLYVSFASDDYHLTAGSPCRDTGDPASPLDGDGSRADMGVFAFGSSAGGGAGEVLWTAAGSPYRVTGNLTVPANLTLRIQPGVSVYFDQNVRMTVNGRFIAEGTPGGRIVFSHVPGSVAAGDADPVKNGTQTGPPKWGGIRIYDSMAQENIVRYCDFINAQGVSPIGSDNYGSIGFIRSWGWVDNCTWAGTHLRMCYGRNSKMTVTYNVFPDMFIFDPVLNRIENPTDFVAAADNNQEPLKVEYPTTDPEVSGNAGYPNGQPAGGHWRVYFNHFYGNRGHNDVFDADSGRWNQAGQFLLDCRYNHFHGLSGDEHIDLGGDAYIASNIFEAATKDQWTSDTGYSNAISSGDKGSGTTIYVVRNLFFDLDHAINCKLNTATVFEHNTVANFNPDFIYPQTGQDVKCAPINFFIPEDGTNPSYGDGAYMGYNLVSNVPRLFSGADARKVNNVVVNDVTTKIEFFHNLVDQIGTNDIGANHPGGIFNATYGVNTVGTPDFVDAGASDYGLRAYSAARGTAPGGLDYGWSVPEWAYVIGGPVGSTAATTADFTVGGPGIVAYKWRLDGGAWSAPIQIGAGGVFPRTGPAVRQVTLNFSNLTPGAHALEVLGQDVAGNWQDADPARNYDAIPQSTPTTRTWTVDQTTPLLRISEVLANGSVLPDTVEIYNAGASPVMLAGWFLTDDPTGAVKVALPATSLAPGAYTMFTNAALNLDKDGDSVYLLQGVTVRDSVSFGSQLLDMTIGRHAAGSVFEWKLGTPTLGAANVAVRTDGLSGIRLSEWFASGDVLYQDDWLELSNSSSFPVDLQGLRITDNRAGQPNQFVVPPLTFIGANGFLKFIADGEAEPRHLPFSLDAEQETLSLLDPSGVLLDTVAFYPQTTDYSMSRDGSGTGFSFYELPTAGLPNSTTNANALALLRGLRITEIMFNAVGGSDYDFVELRNVGATPFELNGVSFDQGISFTFGAQTLNPGQNIIVVKNVAKFRLRYGDGPLVAGAFSGQLDNGGEPLALRLPPPFDANILTFDYSDEWFVGTDGDGLSIVVGAPATAAARDWDERETWSASTAGGNPAGVPARTDTYTGWITLNHALNPNQDDDRDGVFALVEFGLGMNPASGLGYDGPPGLPDAGLDGTGHLQISFLVPQNLAANGGHGFLDTVLRVDASDNLIGWSNIASKSFAAPWTGSVFVGAPLNGYVPVTVTDSTGPTGTKRYLRFRVEWVP